MLNVLNNVSKAPFLWLTATQYEYESSYNISSAQTYFIQFVSCLSISHGQKVRCNLEFVESAKMTGIWPDNGTNGITSTRRLDPPAARLDAMMPS